jgi:hypothetical protein
VIPKGAAETIFQSKSNEGTRTRTTNAVRSDQSGNAKQQSQPMVLNGVVACFSGFSLEDKDRYHEAVVGLGGK